ncbi:hypothetical protein [Bacillus pseudomycoides]|uniref:hypothetical protein n=1 Tax=Bacillus pseudomycoides TaxID=64104 RepID=UPI001C54EAB2|nr:hypothetical protein [Bacillus pseudomycoides]
MNQSGSYGWLVFSSRLTPYQPLVRGKVKLSFANVLPVKGYLLPITIIQVNLLFLSCFFVISYFNGAK